MENILNKIILCKNEYYYYNGKIWQKIKETELEEILKKNGMDPKEIKKGIKKYDIIKNSKDEMRYIGFNNGVYDIKEKELIVNKDIIITSLSDYTYEKVIEKDDETKTNELYEYLMVSMYDVIVNSSNKYILQSEKLNECIMVSLLEIFGNVIQFINMESNSKRIMPRVIYYGTKVSEDIKYEGKIVIPIGELGKIEITDYNKVFNNVLNKYSDISEKNRYIVPMNVNIIKRYNIEIYEKPGRPKKYKTVEEIKQAKIESGKKWRQKAESKKKIAKSSSKYYHNNKDVVLLRNRLNKKNKKVTESHGKEIELNENVIESKVERNVIESKVERDVIESKAEMNVKTEVIDGKLKANIVEVKKNKELSGQSKKTYEYNLKRVLRIYLGKEYNGEYNGEVIKIKTLMEIMRKKQINMNSQRSMLTALKDKYKCGLVKIDSVEDLDYETKRINDILDSKEKKCKLSESQRKQFTSWYNILKVYNKIKELSLKTKNKTVWEDRLLLSFYVLIPPRRNEVAYMYIGNENEYVLEDKLIMNVNTINYKKIESNENEDHLDNIKINETSKDKINTEDNINDMGIEYDQDDDNQDDEDDQDDEVNQDEEKNLYIDKGNKSYLIFRRYKTDGTYSDQILEITSEFRNVINEYIKIKNLKTGDKLIDKKADEITKRLNKIFEVLIKKKISSSLLRHIFISHCEYKRLLKTPEEKENLSKMMGHSVGTQMKYYRCGYERVINKDLQLISEGPLYRTPGRPKKK